MVDGAVELFGENEVKRAVFIKRRLLVVYFASLILVLTIILTLGGINLYMVNSSYDRSMQVLFTFVSAVLGAGFSMASLFFFSIKYRLTLRYVKMLKGFEKGILDTSTVSFITYDRALVYKDGVYFYTMQVNSKPLRRDDITLRNILIEHTLVPPPFVEGDKISVTTHGVILVRYKVLTD